MKLHTSIDQTFSQIAVSPSVGVIAFSDNGKVYVNRYTLGADVETLFEFNADPVAIALSPSFTYCAYTVGTQTYVRELATATETLHEASGQICVNDQGDLLATNPIYHNGNLDVVLHGNVMCTFTKRGFAFATEREVYDGDSISITAESIVGVWRNFFATDQGTLFNYSGVNIQRTNLKITNVFDYGTHAGVYDGETLYVTDGYFFRETTETTPLVEAPPRIAKYALPVSLKKGVAGAFRQGRYGAGRPTRAEEGIYLHVKQTTALEFYVGAENLQTSGTFDTTKYRDFIADFRSIFFVGENTDLHVDIGGITDTFDGIRIATSASLPELENNLALLKGVVFSTEPVPNGVGDIYTAMQYRFINNSPVDEVTEAEVTLSGAAVITNNKLVTNPPSYLNYGAFNPIIFGLNEDFCIRISVNMPFSDARNYNTILGVWETTATNGAWGFGRNGSEAPTGKLRFFVKDTAGVLRSIYSTSTLRANTDYTIELSRKDGIVYLFINGILEAQASMPQAMSYTNLPPMRTDVVYAVNQNVSTHLGGGSKWDIQIVKGKAGHTASYTPAPLEEYKRPELSEADFDAIILQLGFRRGSVMCEKFDTPLQLFGTAAVTKRARLTQTNAVTSYASIPIPYFGAGDFSIEFMCNITAISANGIRLGHWSAVASGEAAKYGILINTARRLSFAIQKTATQNDWEQVASADGVFELARDNHVVIQRVGGQVTIYLNDVAVATGLLNVPMRPSLVFRTNGMQGTDSMAGQLWNIRIADKAMYQQNRA